MLTDGGARSHHGSMPAVAESARRTSSVSTRPPRNDSIVASVGFAHRTQMTGWSNVVRAVISKVLPTFQHPLRSTTDRWAGLARPLTATVTQPVA
jgi:hypothetical protein